MPKRKIHDDSDFEGADDDEWEEDGAAAADDDDDDGSEEEEDEKVWANRRKRKPISPVRTRAARGGKVTGPSRNRAVPVEQYKAQWIKKGSAQSGEGYGSQLRLIDYLGADKSLMTRFGYKGDKSSTSTAKKPSALSSRCEKPEPEDEAFIDDGSDVEASIQLDDDEEEAELVFSDDDSAPRQPKKTRRLRKKRDVVLALGSNDEDEYNDDDGEVEIVSTTNNGGGGAEANDEDEDEDLKRALRKSRMEMLRDRSRRRNEERETRQVLRISSREVEKSKNARSSKIKVGSDEDEAEEEEEEENGDEDEESDEDVAAVNNLLAKCESAADRLHSYLQQLHAAQTKGEVGQTDSGVTVLKQPHTIQRTLKSYQVAGLNWLYALHTQKLNGILADEMGLGKTVQTISLLAQLLLDGNRGPHIIIVPASTLHNWKKELASWCPALKVFIYYGNMAERSEMRVELKSVPEDYYNVWVTTYSVAQSKHDRSFLRNRKFKYMVLDEAQNIKNTSSQRYKSLFSLNSKNRLLLTGTPVENTMNELMALLYFLLPRLFGSARDYEELKVHLARAQKRSDLLESGFISRMKQIVTPFLLRRLKSEVSIELDPKKERIARCPMPDVQAQLYDDLLSRSKKHIAEKMEDASLALVEEVMDDEEPRPKAAASATKKKKPVPPSPKKLSNNTFMNICMQLIKMADHPLLLRSNYTDQKVREIAQLLKRYYPDEFEGLLSEVAEDLQLNSDFVIHQVVASRKKIPASYRLNLDNLWEASAKMEYLRTLLPELFAQDRRVLIFSLMTKMLDILEVFLEKIGYRFLRLDGSTPVSERQEMIDEFNTDLSIPIFLLSTKAGGLGINLTSADTVIFYDSSFNPQVDRQAEDRVHRLGQLKQVEIIRLVSENTIDEHILKMAEQKKKLSEALLAEGSYAAKDGSGPSAMDVKDILKVITASVHAPSPLANRPPAPQRAHTGAKPKPPVLFLEDDADATTATTPSVGANGHGNAGRTTQQNGLHSTAESARKRKRIAAEEEEDEDEQEDKETRDKGEDRVKTRTQHSTKADVKDNLVEKAKAKVNKRQKLEDEDEDEEPKTSTTNGSSTKKKPTTSAEGAKRADNNNNKTSSSTSSSATTSKAKPKQLTLEEFKRKYSSSSTKS